MAEPALNPAPKASAGVPGKPPLQLWFAHPAFISLLLAAATAIAFYPLIHNQFVSYDDPDYVTENPHVKAGLTSAGVAWAFATAHAGNWHPLTWLSHMLDVQLFRLNPAAHHLINALFHIANSVLLFFLLWRLTGALWRSAFVAALFALHPLHVESVAWISERKDLLSGLFFMLALLAYSGYAQETRRGNRLRFYMLSLVLFALGLMSKPMLVTLPFVLLLLDFWPLGRLRTVKLPALLAEKIPFFALSAASCLVTLFVQREAEQPLSVLPMTARLGNTLVSYVRYIGKMFWPFNLATPYPHPGRWPAGDVILAALLLCALSLAALAAWRRFPFVLVGWLWFLGMLVPVIGLVQVGEQSMADRYTYLPLIGLFIALVWVAAEARIRLHMPPAVVAFAACLLLVLCALRARDQVSYWQGSDRLFSHAIRVSKANFIAYYNLGTYLDHAGRTDEALTNYMRALEIQPHYQDPLNNIGCILAERKQFAESVPYFEAALRYKSDYTDARANLANSLRKIGRYKDAIPEYRTVVEKRPSDTSALNGLGNALASQGQFAEAIPVYEASLRAKPEQAAAHYDLANAFQQLRRLDDAVAQYRLALAAGGDDPQIHHDFGVALAMRGNTDESIAELRLANHARPDNAAFALSLAKILGSRGRFDEALPLFADAVRLAPDNPEAHNGLGTTLALAGRMNEAVEQFELSLRLRPASVITHFNLGKALAALGKSDEARAQFNEALRLKPDYAPAIQELNSLGPPKSQ
jgi:tetratricopeptide (TPR) repeat protein